MFIKLSTNGGSETIFVAVEHITAVTKVKGYANGASVYVTEGPGGNFGNRFDVNENPEDIINKLAAAGVKMI